MKLNTVLVVRIATRVLLSGYFNYVLSYITSGASLTIGSFGMFWGIASLGVYRYSMIIKLDPVFTTMFGVLLVQDFLNASQYCGIAFVVFSLVALQLFDKQKENG